MARPASSFTAWAIKFYEQYLENKKTDGGWCDDYVTAGLKEILENPDETGASKALLELAAKAMRGIWHDDPKTKENDLFSVAGVETERTYTWADAGVPGFHRRVSARWATIRQAERDWLLKNAKAIEMTESANLQAEKLAKIKMVINDPDALLWDYRDVNPKPLPDDGIRPSPS